MKYIRPIIEILRFDEEEVLTESARSSSMNQEAQYFTGVKGTGSTTGVDVRQIPINIQQ